MSPENKGNFLSKKAKNFRESRPRNEGGENWQKVFALWSQQRGGRKSKKDASGSSPHPDRGEPRIIHGILKEGKSKKAQGREEGGARNSGCPSPEEMTTNSQGIRKGLRLAATNLVARKKTVLEEERSLLSSFTKGGEKVGG